MPLSGYSTYLNLAPSDGPKQITLDIDFSLGATQVFDLVKEELAKQIGFVQSMYVDQSQNANIVTMTIAISNQRMTFKPNTQGYYPAIVSDQMSFSITSAAANGKTRIHFLNTPQSAAQWPTT